jgi:hypothetical protein
MRVESLLLPDEYIVWQERPYPQVSQLIVRFLVLLFLVGAGIACFVFGFAVTSMMYAVMGMASKDLPGGFLVWQWGLSLFLLIVFVLSGAFCILSGISQFVSACWRKTYAVTNKRVIMTTPAAVCGIIPANTQVACYDPEDLGQIQVN